MPESKKHTPRADKGYPIEGRSLSIAKSTEIHNTYLAQQQAAVLAEQNAKQAREDALKEFMTKQLIEQGGKQVWVPSEHKPKKYYTNQEACIEVLGAFCGVTSSAARRAMGAFAAGGAAILAAGTQCFHKAGSPGVEGAEPPTPEPAGQGR